MTSARSRRPYASIPRRLFSYCADVVLLFAGLLLLQGILIALRLNPLVQGVQSGAGLSKGIYHLWLLGTVDLPLVLYYAGTLASSAQATVAMRWLGLRLENENGLPIRRRQALLRTVVMLIPFEVNHLFLVWASTPQGIPTQLALQYAAVGALALLFLATAARSPRRQSLHDRVANTTVVDTRNPS